jgi:hypothetical protein
MSEKSIDKITKAGAKSKDEVIKQDTEADKKAQELEDKRKARIEEANQLRKAQLEQIKEYYKTAKDENEAKGLAIKDLLTKQNLEKWLIDEGRTYSYIAQYYVGCDDKIVSVPFFSNVLFVKVCEPASTPIHNPGNVLLSTPNKNEFALDLI